MRERERKRQKSVEELKQQASAKVLSWRRKERKAAGAEREGSGGSWLSEGERDARAREKGKRRSRLRVEAAGVSEGC